VSVVGEFTGSEHEQCNRQDKKDECLLFFGEHIVCTKHKEDDHEFRDHGKEYRTCEQAHHEHHSTGELYVRCEHGLECGQWPSALREFRRHLIKSFKHL